MLVDKDEELPVFHKGKEVKAVEAVVKDGFAVTEVELKHCKELANNKDWLDKLKNGFYDTKGKTSHLFIKIENPNETIFAIKQFLRQNPFKLIRSNWHEPVDDPQIAIYNQHGTEKAKSNTFGMGRGRFHSGLDIFSIEGSKVYACLDAEVFETQEWVRNTGDSGYGHSITLKVKVPQEFKNRRRNYEKAFKTDLDKKASFDKDSNIFLLRYNHLEDILVKKGEKVKAGDVIGKTGISGIIKYGTHDPHLHFNIYSTAKKQKFLVNPAYYVYWKEIGDLTIEDKKIQKDRKDEGYKTNNNPKISVKDPKRVKIR